MSPFILKCGAVVLLSALIVRTDSDIEPLTSHLSGQAGEDGLHRDSTHAIQEVASEKAALMLGEKVGLWRRRRRTNTARRRRTPKRPKSSTFVLSMIAQGASVDESCMVSMMHYTKLIPLSGPRKELGESSRRKVSWRRRRRTKDETDKNNESISQQKKVRSSTLSTSKCPCAKAKST